MSSTTTGEGVLSSPEQALAAIRGSVVQQTVYHAIRPFGISNAEKTLADITANGFQVDPAGWGAWGIGVYFALDRHTLGFYDKVWNGLSYEHGSPIIHAKVNIQRPLFIHSDGGNSNLTYMDDFLDSHGMPSKRRGAGAEFDERVRPAHRWTKHLKSQGYDGVIYTELVPDMGPGGNQVLVFDPAQIHIIKIERP